MESKKIIVANWKLERSFAQAHEWVKAHRDDLSELANQVQLVLCPDVITTASLGPLLQGTGVVLGAQDCSPYLSGKHTASISAQSLQEAGCTYALIGHSEQRATSTVTPSGYAVSCGMALTHGINPILCLGEPANDRFNEPAIKKLFTSHLEPLCTVFRSPDFKSRSGILHVAYEPLWAIGSSKSASPGEVSQRISWLRELAEACGATPSIKFMYGGGITPENTLLLGGISHLDGLLLGSSSLDMQSLKKIVYSFIK